MEGRSPTTSPLLSSPFSSPNVGALLKIKIISWSQETGLPISVRVRVSGRVFDLHKPPLLTKSGYFNRKLRESNEIELPPEFPGGAETFEMIALFVYGSSTLVDPFNVAALRCAAEFLEMTEDFSPGNLCERFDIYLNQVVLQSWEDTLIVLQKCQALLPLAEELLVVSRCVESLAFMACMEILDPESRREQPVVTLEALADKPWKSETVKEIVSQDLWIKDLVTLPFGFFSRAIGSMRRQGMNEKYVCPIILFYANKWLLSDKSYRSRGGNSSSDKKSEEDEAANSRGLTLLQGIIDLLPARDKASKVIPVGFYLSLLSRSLKLGLKGECKARLQDQIASQLHLAQVEDLLLLLPVPCATEEKLSPSQDLATMESIFLAYVSSMAESNHTPTPINTKVAELWDAYLSHIATDQDMRPKRFMYLVELVPISCRRSHDHLYRALNTFLIAHPDISQDERGLLCKYLNCQKLSQQACIEAVQNESMPLRLIVQALFVQQLNTHQAFKECSDSFRYTHCGESSGSLSSSRYANSKSQNQGESPYMDIDGGEAGGRPFFFLQQRDSMMHRPVGDFSKKDYESTSFRIQTLEKELVSLKKSLQLQNTSKKAEPATLDKSRSFRPFALDAKTMSRKINTAGQITSCIGSVNFTSQRKCVSRLLKVFRRMSLFGRGKSKRRTGAPGL